MSEEEAEWTIALLRQEIEELQERVSDLEMRANRDHSCAVDINCRYDQHGQCVLDPKWEEWDE